MTSMFNSNAAESLLSAPPAHETVDSASPARPEAMDLIFIEGFEGETVVGINKDEVGLPQTVRIDVVAGRPRIQACVTDKIADTMDYGAIHAELKRILATHRVRMLEALAESIAAMLIEAFGAHWVRVVLAKPRKFDDVAAVGVVIERRRKIETKAAGAGGDESPVTYLRRADPSD
jgi:dihydroneopterin aldolase